jgi:uncharacterized repeat protein (TIGR01451 family)
MLSITKFPEVVYIDGEYAEWNIEVVNSGAGTAYNVEVIDTLGDVLEFRSGSWSAGGGTVTPHADNTDPDGGAINGKSYTISQLDPGESRTLTLQAEFTGCDTSTNSVLARVRCNGETCDDASDSTDVRYTETDLVVSTTFINPGTSCDTKTIQIELRNAGLTNVFDIDINQVIPNDLQYITGSSEYRLNQVGGWLGAGSTEPSIAGNQLTWSYNGALPVALTDKLSVLYPGEIVEIQFEAYVHCFFRGGDLRFWAEFEECGGAGRETTTESTFAILPNMPDLTVTKTTTTPEITCQDNVEWALSITNAEFGVDENGASTGTAVTAEYVQLRDTLGDAFNIGTIQLYDPSNNLMALGTDYTVSGRDIAWEILNLAPDTTLTYRLIAEFDNRSGDLERI